MFVDTLLVANKEKCIFCSSPVMSEIYTVHTFMKTSILTFLKQSPPCASKLLQIATPSAKPPEKTALSTACAAHNGHTPSNFNVKVITGRFREVVPQSLRCYERLGHSWLCLPAAKTSWWSPIKKDSQTHAYPTSNRLNTCNIHQSMVMWMIWMIWTWFFPYSISSYTSMMDTQ